MSQAIFEAAHRWPGAPPVCVYENLPAFESTDAVNDYRALYCPSVTVFDVWLCQRCNRWHFTATEMPGSGASSGTARKCKEPVPRYKNPLYKENAV